MSSQNRTDLSWKTDDQEFKVISGPAELLYTLNMSNVSFGDLL